MTLEPARAKKWALGIAALFGVGSLRLGLLADDHFFRAILQGFKWFNQGAWDGYVFAPGDRARFQPFIEFGPYPWWTLEELRVRFGRPLSSLLFWFDVEVFGKAAWPAHLHSVLWWLAAVALVCALYQRMLGPRAAALAMLLFAIDDAHWLPVAWLSNRHVLVSAVPALAGFWLWRRWIEERAAWAQWAAMGLFALALMGGESAVSVMAYVGTWTVLRAPGKEREGARALVPLAVLGALYVVVYKLAGFGTYGSAVYIDPASQPLAFLAAAPLRLLTLVGTITLGIPADLFMGHPVAPYVLSGLGLLAAVGALLALRFLWPTLDERSRAGLRWLVPGALLSLVPCLATWPTDRLLMGASIGGMALLAVLADAALTRAGGWKPLLGAMALMHLVLPLVVWAVYPPGAAALDRRFNEVSVRSAKHGAAMRGKVIFVAAPDLLISLYLPLYLREDGHGDPVSWNILSVAQFDHLVTRTGERSFDLEAIDGAFVQTRWERLFRDPDAQPFLAGQTVRLAGGTLTITSLRAGLPNRVHLELPEPVEHFTFVQWKNGELELFELPPVGSAVKLVRETGPLEQALGVNTSH